MPTLTIAATAMPIVSTAHFMIKAVFLRLIRAYHSILVLIPKNTVYKHEHSI